MDKAVVLWVNQHWVHPWLDVLFVWVSDKLFFSLPLLAIILVLLTRRWGGDGFKLGVALIVMVVVADAFGAVLKELLQQARPCLELYSQLRHPTHEYLACDEHNGMPSNHALNFFAAFAFLTYILRSWRWSVPLLLTSLCVALSRVYLGAHYPSQVLAGIVLGLVVGAMAARIAVHWLAAIQRVHATRAGVFY